MNFKDKIKNSFAKVKRDIDVLKVSLVDWIRFLRHGQALQEQRIQALERRVAELEQEQQLIVTTY